LHSSKPKLTKKAKYGGFGEMDDREYRIWLRWWRSGWRRVIDSGVCKLDEDSASDAKAEGKDCESDDKTIGGD